MPSSRIIYFLLLLTALHCSAVANETPSLNPQSAPIFSSFDPLAFTLNAPFERLFSVRDKEQTNAKKTEVLGTLMFAGRTIPVRIRMRGYSSLRCKFPKLALKFRTEDVAGTLLEGLRKIDLGTHCDLDPLSENSFESMRFNHREALIYRWLQILRIPSYAARPALGTYVDSEAGSAAPIIAQAFFLEHLSSFLERINGVEIRAKDDFLHPDAKPSREFRNEYTDVSNHAQIDRAQLARMFLFQSFIGNADCRLNKIEIWNLKLIEIPDGRWFPVPMDFNFSSLAMGREAKYLSVQEVYFSELSAADRISMIEEYEAVRGELYASLTALTNDSVGLSVYRASLNAQFANLQKLKGELRAPL